MATSSRRVPLASLSNATNSPHRTLTHSGNKRPRSLANLPQQENEPPQKRLAGGRAVRPVFVTVTPQKQAQPPTSESRVFERGHGESRSTAFERKLVAARDRDRTAGPRATKVVDGQAEREGFKTWQRQYRKLFPTFRFYFDAFSDEARSRFMRQISALGGREEQFFSRDVTTIVTTRSIPTELDTNSSIGNGSSQRISADAQPQTINPSLLERNPRGQAVTSTPRNGANQMDVLITGKAMGMKIYTVDKMQRVLNSLLAATDPHGHNTRGSTNPTRTQREDLGEVLRNEKLGAASEKEMPFASLAPFKALFIYVHDMEERYRPTMVREYPKPSTRADGDWPQFRSASIGKCPFVIDHNFEQEQRRAQKRVVQQEQQRQLQQRREQQVPRTRSHISLAPEQTEPATHAGPRRPLAPVQVTANSTVDMAREEREPKSLSSHTGRQPSFPPMPTRAEFEFVRPPKLNMAREPAASGIQRSNLTSAIQSQMVSSTAATGVKAGTSKEVHQQLKRQVLERTHTASLSVGSIPSSHRMNDLAGALKTARAPAPQRAAKSKAQEKLGGIQEEIDPHEDDIAAETAAHASRKKKAARRDPKPGYCENCRDKYDDFDEHVVSRKHRKFAMTQSNWTDLDALLAKLQDP